MQLRSQSRMLVDAEESQGLEPDIHVRMAHVYRDGESFVAHKTSAHGLLCVLSGSGDLLINGQLLALKKQHCIYYAPGMHLRWHSKSCCLCRFTIKGQRAEKIMTDAGIQAARTIAVSHALRTQITEHMLRFQDVKTRLHKQVPIAFAWELITGLSQKHAPIVDQAEAIKVLIDEHYHDAVHINELADRIGINRSTLFRQFKKRYAMSPKAYLDNCRFGNALRLIESGTMNIGQIAQYCGFEDVDHFSRRFKQRYNVVPSQYRRE